MEHEVRYYFSNSKLKELKDILGKYIYQFSARELTVMYDNPNSKLTFYNQKVDGRLRLRTSKTLGRSEFGAKNNKDQKSFCLLTWKRRLPENKVGNIRHEEEIECTINPDDSENIERILSCVLKCPRISSYERIRHNFDSKCSKITLDEFPYGLMLEFELKNDCDEADLILEVESCGLKLDDASNMSCDDKYFDLCRLNDIKTKSDILFSDSNMPEI